MRKFWIFLLVIFLIVFGLAVGCAVSDSFKLWFTDFLLGVSGKTGQAIATWWVGVVANPIYQQWHMLIWFAGGVIGTVIFAKVLWPRAPAVLHKKEALAAPAYQHSPTPSLPQSNVEPMPQATTTPEPEPKQEEKGAAE